LIINVLKDRGVIEGLKSVADGKGKYADDIRDDARTAYEQWVIRVQEIRGKLRWKTMRTKSSSTGCVLQRE